MSKIVYFILILSFSTTKFQWLDKDRYKCPPESIDYNDDCLKTSKDAIKTAKQKWVDKYGKHINQRGPFTAKLIGDSVWVVSSSPKRLIQNSDSRTFLFGGILSISLRKRDCKVLSIETTK